MKKWKVVYFFVLLHMRSQNYSCLLGSGQVFTSDTWCIPFFIEGGFFIVPSRSAIGGFGVLYKSVESYRSQSLKWACILREKISFCLFIIFLLFFSLNYSHLSLSQGEAKVFALLEGLETVPEHAEVYVVLEGSTLVHVTRAQNDVMLYFIVPGMHSVFACLF